MEGSQGSNYDLRSRSRSNTPLPGESANADDNATGRKTPLKRDTPVKQLLSAPSKIREEVIVEEEETSSPHSHMTRQVTKSLRNRLSTDGTPEPGEKTRRGTGRNLRDRLSTDGTGTPEPEDLRREITRRRINRMSADGGASEAYGDLRKEIVQNNINSIYEFERVSNQHYGETLADVALSPITAHSQSSSYNVSGHRSFSPAYSVSSTDSLFVEQTLQDVSALVDSDPDNLDHLPSRLYKLSGEYWNKYPKTDYTYSLLSKDRVELAPGQVAVPNMSRRSLKHFRIFGPNTSLDEVDDVVKENSWFSSSARKRFVAAESSDDEDLTYEKSLRSSTSQWWLTSVLTSLITMIVTSTKNGYRSVFGQQKGYPYTNLPPRKGVLHKSASLLAAPFIWIYSIITSTVTTTITTITETITENTSSKQYTPAFAIPVKQKRRRWPWLLLLLLPLLGYGYYYYEPQIKTIADKVKQDLPTNLPLQYFPPKREIDVELTNRVATLEKWATNVDSKLKYFDEKLSNFDNLETQIEAYSIKYLQQNIVNMLSENNKKLGDELRLRFERDFVSKDDLERIKVEIYEKLMASWEPDMNEDVIRKIIQEHLAVFEKSQMKLLVETVREYVKEVHVKRVESGFDEERVKAIVAAMLHVYDSDKTGLVDYALESAGGQILSTRCTELYQIKTKQYSLLGMPVWWVYTSPRYALTPGAMPAECWAFQGFPGYLVVKTYAVIEVTSFSIEHMSKLLAIDGKIESAPKNFSVYGLHFEQDTNPHLFGNYMYDDNGTSIQYFPVQYPKTQKIDGVDYPVAFDIVELRVETNYGNPTYTCVYRFRVHGNPLSDIRRATQDSIHEN